MRYYSTGLTEETDRIFVAERHKRLLPETGRLVCFLYRKWIYFWILFSSAENFQTVCSDLNNLQIAQKKLAK